MRLSFRRPLPDKHQPGNHQGANSNVFDHLVGAGEACIAAKAARSCPLWVMCGRRLIDKGSFT